MGSMMSRLSSIFRRSPFARNVLLMSSATSLGQLLVIAAAPILTRLFSPEDFGVLGVYASILGIVSVVASLRYEQAIPLPKSDAVAANVLVAALYFALLISLVTGIAIFFFKTRIAELVGLSGHEYTLYLIPVGVLLVGAFQCLSNWAIRKEAFPAIAQTTLMQGGGSVATQLAAGIVGAGAPGLVIGQIVGQVAGLGRLARLLVNDPGRPIKSVSTRNLKRVIGRYRSFPIVFTWSALLNSIGLMGPTILLAAFYGATVVGWYALVQRILGVPTSLLGRAVTNAFFSESARLAREDPPELGRLFLSVLKNLTLMGVVTIVPLGLISPWLFPFVFGDNWTTAGRYAMILTPMILLQFLTSPFGVILAVLERKDLAMIREIGRVLLVGAALFYANEQNFDPEQAIVLLSIAGILSYLLHLFVSWRAIRQRIVSAAVRS